VLATFDHAEPHAGNISSFWFKPEKPTKQTAGQFIEMRLQHDGRDKRGDKRWFTLSSSPTDELVSITTKFAADFSKGGGSSFKQALRSLQPGEQLQISDPMGDFVLPKDPGIPLVFVAGGIGLTPFHSIVKWLADTGERRDIHMLYGVNTDKEIVFRDLFESYGLKLDIIVKNPSPGWKGLTGSLSGERILKLIGNVDNKLIYISGHEPMVENFGKDLDKLGVNKKQIVQDFFPNYSEI
jgi:glycine betaine catabolism B